MHKDKDLIPGRDYSVLSEEDIKELRTKLKVMSTEERERILEKQIHHVTAQILLVKNGIPFARAILDSTLEGINSHFLESKNWKFYEEKPFTGNLGKTVNFVSGNYWSCKCPKDFIHHNAQIACRVCGHSLVNDTHKYKPIHELYNLK